MGDPDASVAMGLQEPRWGWRRRLRAMGHQSQLLEHSPSCVGELKYCRHSNRKTKEETRQTSRSRRSIRIHPNAKGPGVSGRQSAGDIDPTRKKKELLGDFKNGGSDYSPQGRPIEVNTHDFEDKELGKVVPYGVYDIGANDGYVSLGIDHDTGQFAVNSVRLWLDRIGRARYHSGMSRLMITADGGGSNGSRLQALEVVAAATSPDETGLTIQVCHYPPGTSTVEQDRASHVLLHHPELARHASSSASTSQSQLADRQHHDEKRAFDQLRTRFATLITKRSKGLRRGNGEPQHNS